MSKELESLVARGKRVRNSREQREITFGLADISTDRNIHERLVKKGGVDTLINLLDNAQDPEAQQFAALALANTSSTGSLCDDIVKIEGVVAGLIQYVGNVERDSIGRQYCAMALGNLLSEQSTHDKITKLGCIDALIKMLANFSVGRDLEAGTNAAFAISNLSSSRCYHDKIVEKGALPLLVALSCSEDPDTQRQALFAIRGLCGTVRNRLKAIENGVLDPLILMARSKEIDIIREVSSLLNCLSSEAENKEEISYRAISTLIYLLLSDDSHIECNACSAIANLIEVTDIHRRLLEERGIPPLISLCASPDAACRTEAFRAVSNISSNNDLIEVLIQEQVLIPLVKSLDNDRDKCRFSALAIANFASNAQSLFEIVNAGAIPRLVSLVFSAEAEIEGRRYAALALANLTAYETYHSTILEYGGPEALFALSNSCDALSQHYICCALANLSCNIANHEPIVKIGGLQPMIALAHDNDQNVHLQAVAALRGFSVTGNIKMKIVQEGGLEPLCRLLLSGNNEVLRETTACLCNLSLGDENKFEISKCGAVAPLISLITSEDSVVACHACECLANLAEMIDIQEIIAREDAVIPCTAAMRSRHIDVRREGARIVANLSASSDKFAVDAIINANGHHLLASFLVSQDDGFQRVGAIGIGNMCTHDHHRVTLMKAGVFEPLSSLARSTKTELDIRRVAMLAIANLAACFSNHDDFINQRTIPMLVSFSNSEDPGIRNYAAFTISELSKNPDMMEAITEAGGLEPVLYLARSDDKKVQRDILTALTTLSFLDRNKSPICMNGALPPIIDCINEGQNGTTVSKLACSAIANMIESTDNMQLIVNHGCVPLLISALESESESVRRESARAIGNLAVSIEYCDMILELGASRRLMSCFQRRNSGCQRFASMALGNVSSNVKSHSELMENNILGLMRNECLVFLDPKQCSDHETVRYCLLIISNMAVAKRSHSFMVDFYDILMDFTRDRDAKCRQYAILALGNLCADPLQVKSLIDAKCSNAMILFSFPPTTEDARSAQFQAIAGLHGLSKIHEYRTALLREGSLEPLILGVRGNSKFSDSEIQHEAAAALSNLSLEEPNRILIAKSGALPALVTLLNEASTSICKVHAVTALANLAESSDEVHTLLINERCIQPLCELVQNQETHTNIKQSASRCFALFASNTDTHRHLLTTSVIASIKILLSSTRDTTCERFGALTVANLALCESNHSVLLKTALLESLLLLHNSGDVETLRGIAFALHSFSKRNENHCALEDANVMKFLPTLMDSMDEDTAFQACLATKFLCQCDRCRNTFSDSCGLKPLLNLVSLDNTEMKQEAAATLWNISLSDKNKNIIMNENGLDIISTLCRSSENELSYLACGIIANISESHENKIRMVKGGIIHHLQYAMLPKSTSVNRESIRAFANLSAAKENIVPIANSGALTNLIEALQSPDALTRRFAAMTMSNLASCEQNIYRIFHEHGIVPLISILRQVDISKNDMCLQQHAMACLANLASCHVLQHDLIEFGCLQLSMEHMKCSNVQLRTYALHCFSNFASNRNTHFFLQTRCTVQELIGNLRCRENQIKLYTAKSLHGLSSDSYFRREIISNNGVEALLPLIQSDDTEVKNEALSTLCNLSLGGFLGDRANNVLQKIDMQSLIGFVRNKDSIYRLFGAVAIGNIASHDNFKSTILDSGALQPLLGACGESSTDIETRRCIALAVCNLASNVTNRSPIINQGGLASIIFLCQSGVSEDMLVALTTLRGFASSASDRRLVFEEGTLSVLSLAMMSGCIECKRESASILALLSLNEENKSDLARSNDIKDFLVLAEDDDYCTKQICRAVGNVCEVVDLHYDLLHFVSVDQLIHLSSHKQESVRVEVSRCFANLSSNCKVHNLLATPKVFANLIAFCSSTDVDTSRYAVLSLANLCLCKNTRLTLEKQELVSGLCQVFKHEPLLTEAQKLDTVAYLKKIETKCYSCMAAIALSTDVFVVRRFIKYGMIPAIIPLLHIGCAELNLYISFLLSKLTSVKSSFDEIVQYRLIEQMQGCNFDTAAQTYYITSLRRLSSDEITRGELDIGTIEFLADSITFENVERCREISASICFLALRDSDKISIMENKNLFSHLLEMCKSSDPEICRFALGSLANIADDVRLHSSLKKMGSLVEFLLRLMENGVVSIVRESSRAMSNLLTSMDTQQEFLKEDGMSVLLDVSKSADKECIYNTSVALRKLASNCFAHIYFFDQNGIEVVMDLSKHDEQDVRIQSATALRDISSNTEFKHRFVESGAMETVFTYFSSDAVMLKILAMDTLRNLSLSMRLKGTLLSNDVVNLTGECITHSNNDKDLLFRCASLIANMAEHAQNKVLLVRMGILRQLVNLCKCTFKSVKMEAARAFSLLSSAPENVDIFDSMIVSTIVGLLDCEEKSACRDSIAAISNIATSHEKVLLIGNCGGIHLLIPFLESPQRDCQRNACIALSRLTVLDKNKRAALNRGGLESLLRLSDSRNEGISQMSLMVLCNLCSLKGYGTKFVNHSVLPRLKRHLTSGRLNSRRYVAIAICNLTSQFSINDHIARQINIVTWIEMMNDADVECRVHAIMVLGNLAAEKSLGSIILKSKVLPSLMSVLATEIDCRLHRAALVALYNISTCEISHTQFEKENSTTLILKSCSSDCALCRRLALMILSNVSCNAITRDSATRNGGLQTSILAVKDKDMTCKRIACICLANMGNSSSSQAQIVVHGGLSALMSLSQVNDGFSREFAFMCLSNLAANKSNHDPLIKQGVFNASIESFKSSNSLGIYHMFSIANLISKSEGLSRIGRDGSFKSLLMLSNSSTIHSRCLALSSLRRLATIRVAREMMMIENVIQVITRECNVTQTETSKEISSCLFNLTLDRSHRVTIAEAAMSKLVVLAESNDLDTIRLSVGAIGNLAEEIDIHPIILSACAQSVVFLRLSHPSIDVKREATRACANLLSSKDLCAHFVVHGVDDLAVVSSSTKCEECCYYSVLSFRKLCLAQNAHQALIEKALRSIIGLLGLQDLKTRKHAAAILRDLSASCHVTSIFLQLGIISTMVELLEGSEKDLQIFAMSCLRHLSDTECIAKNLGSSRIMQAVKRCLFLANEDMKCQIAGLFANISEYRECHPVMIADGVISGISELSLTDNKEIWQDCARSFANLCSHEGKQVLIYRKGCVKTLVKLSSSKCPLCQRYVAIAMRFIVSSVEVQNSLSKDNEFAPFIVLSNSKFLDFVRSSSSVMATMSETHTGQSIVLKNGGMKSLLRLINHSDFFIQREAMRCVANFAGSHSFRQYVVKEGGVETVTVAATTCGGIDVLRDSSRAFSSFSIDNATRSIMIAQEVSKVIFKLSKSSDSQTQRFAALALCNMCLGTLNQRETVVKQGVLRVLLFLLRYPDVEIERCAALSIASLSLGSIKNKTEIMKHGFIAPLISTTTYPDKNIQRCAVLALNGVALGESTEPKISIYEEGHLSSLIALVKSEDVECIHTGIYLLGTLAENMDIRNFFVSSNALHVIVEKLATGSIEVKRAASYLLCLLSECKEYHYLLESAGALEQVVAIASLVDEECEECGAFSLALLARNKSFQVKLTNMGAVRPLVSMMARNSASEHYAADALVQISNNRETHVRLAEDGGIQALLKLGQGKVAAGRDDLQDQAKISVGDFAKAVSKQL